LLHRPIQAGDRLFRYKNNILWAQLKISGINQINRIDRIEVPRRNPPKFFIFGWPTQNIDLRYIPRSRRNTTDIKQRVS
jgi:hypothetical protein